MAEVTVNELAKSVGAPADRLLKQMREAGLPQTSGSDLVTDFHKQALLVFLKNSHGDSSSSSKHIVLKRSVFYSNNSDFENSEPSIETEEPLVAAPKVFISYSWDSEEHKAWVKTIAGMLRSDGVDAILDQWDLHPGDQVTHFMETSIKNSDFVLVICTPTYKLKSDSKVGGAGYEDSIISSDMFNNLNHRKYLPIIRAGSHIDSMPNSFHSKLFINFSEESKNFSDSYRDLLITLFGQRPKAPPLGKAPSFVNS